MSDETRSQATADAWIGEAWRTTRDAIVLFARTIGAFLRRQGLMRARVAGEEQPMNPLGYLRMCLLVAAPAHFVLSLRTHVLMDEAAAKMHLPGEALDIMKSLEPYLVALLLSVAAHGAPAAVRREAVVRARSRGANALSGTHGVRRWKAVAAPVAIVALTVAIAALEHAFLRPR